MRIRIKHRRMTIKDWKYWAIFMSCQWTIAMFLIFMMLLRMKEMI